MTATLMCGAQLLYPAAAAGLASWVLLHNVQIRGDVGALLVSVGYGALYAHASLNGAQSPGSVAAGTMLIHLTTLLLATVAYRLSPWHPLARFPGPLINKITNLRYSYTVFTGRRYLIVEELHKKYGKFVRIGPNSLSINSHAAVSPIYSNAHAMDKSDAYSLRQLPGDGLFFMQDRVAHGFRRDMWAGAFTPSALAKFEPVMERRTVELTECMERRKEENGAVNLSLAIEHWSYDFMGEMVYGRAGQLELMRDGDPQKLVKGGEAATIAFDVLGEAPWLFDILWYLPLTASIRGLQNLAARLIKKRAEAKDLDEDKEDIASFLFGVNKSTQKKLTPDELTMDSVFAIQAGSDTSANVLQFAFFFITRYQAVYKKIQAELDEAFPQHESALDQTVLANLPYLNAVINESLRMGTPLSGLPRVTGPSGAHLDGMFIPANTVVSVPHYVQQLDESNFWPRPREFVPERWLPGGLGPDSRANPGAIMSFSFGPFGCLGRTLAIQELRVVIARLVLEFDMTFPKGFDPEWFQTNIRNIRTTLFPVPLRVIATRRFAH